MKKITDYRKQWAELEVDPNPFALVVRAYLKALDSEKNEGELYHWKRYFILEAYGRGMRPETVAAIIKFIDWIITLPEELEIEILDAVRTLEETNNMPHMMTAERLGMKKGREEGIQEFFLSQVDARFGAVPEEIQRRIRNMKDTERLKQIARTLFQVQSLEELRHAMD